MTEIVVNQEHRVSVSIAQIQAYLIATGWSKHVNEYRSPRGGKVAIALYNGEKIAVNTIAQIEGKSTYKVWQQIMDLGRDELVDLTKKYRTVRGDK